MSAWLEKLLLGALPPTTMLMKAHAKRLVARVYRLRSPSKARVVVLCYHSIHPTKAFASASPDLFESHLNWLKEHCDLISFRDALRVARTNPSLGSRPAVAITFDDGYADNYEYGFPLLEFYRVPATVFVTIGLVEKDVWVAEFLRSVRECELEDIRALTWDRIREMYAGGVEFGAHTCSHRNLARLSRADARGEVTRAREILEEQLGTPIDVMAYPFGKPGRHYLPQTIEIVGESGYSYAAATVSRGVRAEDSELEVPRFFVAGDDLETLEGKVRGAWDFLGLWHEWAPQWVSRVISPKDFRV